MQSIYHPTAEVVPRRLAFYSRPRIAQAIAEDCYILAVFYLFQTADFSTSLGRFSRNFATRRRVS